MLLPTARAAVHRAPAAWSERRRSRRRERGIRRSRRGVRRSLPDLRGTAGTIRSSYRFQERVELVLQQIACTKQLVLHRAEGQLLHRSDLLVRQLRVMAELNQLAIIRWKIIDGFLDGRTHLLVAQRTIRRDAVVRELPFL